MFCMKYYKQCDRQLGKKTQAAQVAHKNIIKSSVLVPDYTVKVTHINKHAIKI